MKRILGLWSIPAALLLITASQGHAQIVNGGFDLPPGPGGTNFGGVFTRYPSGNTTGIVGWTVGDGTNSASGQGTVDLVNSGAFPPFNGTQSVDLDGNTPGSLRQTFATTPGQLYQLTFEYANNPGGASANANFSVTGAGTLLSGGIPHSGSTTLAMNYTLFSGTFTANSATTTLLFNSLDPNPDEFGVVVDAVAVTPLATPAAIPEPASIMLLGLPVGFWAVRRLRRRRAQQVA